MLIQLISQILIILLALVLLSAIRRMIPKERRHHLQAVDVMPILCLWFMWQLSRNWPDPWFASLICLWMLASIGVTLWWGLSNGELLWNRFLLFYWRLSTIILVVMYVVTIVSWLVRG